MLAALSLAIDLGLGQPMEHMLRSAIIASRVAGALGLEEEERATAYYATLVMWIGCHADSHEYAAWFGDDIAVRADSYDLDWSGLPYMAFLVKNVGRGRSFPRRAATLGGMFVDAKGNLSRMIRSHCTSAGIMAEHVGLGTEIREVLAFTFERWDGGGLPEGVGGADIPVAMRVAQLADVAEVHLRLHGVDAAVKTVRQRSGRQFDPEVVDAFAVCAHDLADELAGDSVEHFAIREAGDAETVLTADEIEAFLVAMGDFVDLKTPFTHGHSRAVAATAAAAGRSLGLPASDVAVLRRAGHLHDVGRIGVSNQIWEKPGPLSTTEWERVRLHPYYGMRIVGRIAGLEAEAMLIEAHHERQDGSGYPRGTSAAGIGTLVRVLAAADSYQTSIEQRPHREALDGDAARARLLGEAKAGRLDPEAVRAVLESVGRPAPRRQSWPDGLTGREVEVLRLVAEARTNRQIARTLGISEKTVRNHVEHVYAKAGVSNRIGASLYATKLGLHGRL